MIAVDSSQIIRQATGTLTKHCTASAVHWTGNWQVVGETVTLVTGLDAGTLN